LHTPQDRLNGRASGSSEAGSASAAAMADFSVAVKRLVPRGSAFRAFPIAFNHLSPSRAWCALLASPAAREIIEVRDLSVPCEALARRRGSPRTPPHARKPPPPPFPFAQTPCHADPAHTAFSLRVQVSPYPEDTVAAWVMLGVCTMVPTRAAL
jgi:hypothetical protein